MTAERRARVGRLCRLAEGEQELARAQMQTAAGRVAALDDERASALSGAAKLAEQKVSLGMRGHLAAAGSRHLVELAARKQELSSELATKREALGEATSRLRSLERLLERIEKADDLRRRQREEAELADLVAVQAARKGVVR